MAALVFTGAHTQNLINNPDFEDGDTPYCFGQADEEWLPFWKSNSNIYLDPNTQQNVRYHSPDLYQGGVFLNPNNSQCKSLSLPSPQGGAYSGNRSIGMGTYELIQTEIGVLTPGLFYTFSAQVQPPFGHPFQWLGNCEIVLSLARQEVKYQNNNPVIGDECTSSYVNYEGGLFQEVFEIGKIDLNIANAVSGEWGRVSTSFRVEEEWIQNNINPAVWLVIEVRMKNYTDTGNNSLCFEDFVHIDAVELVQSTFCDSKCSPTLPTITYSTDPNNYNNQMPNGMAAGGYVEINPGQFLNPFVLYVKDAMGIDFALYDDQFQSSVPFYTRSAFDPNGLRDVGFDDYQFFWDGAMDDGSYVQQDTYFYTMRIWSCNSYVYEPNQDLQYLVAGSFDFGVTEIQNFDLKNCCDNFEIYDNITFPNLFRKDVSNFILAGPTSPTIVQSGSSVKFFAGNNIILGPNFIAQPGSNFTAEIQDCVYGNKSVENVRIRPDELYPPQPEAILKDVIINNSISNSGIIDFYTLGDINVSKYTILDMAGNILSSNSLRSSTKGTIDVSMFSNGMYIINFETNDGNGYSKKIVLSK